MCKRFLLGCGIAEACPVEQDEILAGEISSCTLVGFEEPVVHGRVGAEMVAQRVEVGHKTAEMLDAVFLPYLLGKAHKRIEYGRIQIGNENVPSADGLVRFALAPARMQMRNIAAKVGNILVAHAGSNGGVEPFVALVETFVVGMLVHFGLHAQFFDECAPLVFITVVLNYGIERQRLLFLLAQVAEHLRHYPPAEQFVIGHISAVGDRLENRVVVGHLFGNAAGCADYLLAHGKEARCVDACLAEGFKPLLRLVCMCCGIERWFHFVDGELSRNNDISFHILYVFKG